MLRDTNGKVLARRIVRFRNVWTQSWGLIFRKPSDDTAYVFIFRKDVRYAVHMLFVFWPIDLYVLDAEKRVLEVVKGLQPFTYHVPRKRFRYLVETRTGMLRLKKGERLWFT